MKKLALALVCFASVAFFASCNESPNPIITNLTEEGYLKDGDVIEVNTPYEFGFQVAADVNGKALSSLVVKIDTLQWANIDLSGKTEYKYIDTVMYSTREIIDNFTITAVVTDAAGKTASSEIKINVNEEQILEEKDFEWYRLGNVITGLEEYGLVWKGNYPKDTYAKLIPAENVKLFIFTSNDWTETTTASKKAALFNAAMETQEAAEEYWNVNVTQGNMTYDDVIGTVMPDGTLNLIHVTKSHTNSSSAGSATTITGKAK